MNVVRLTLKNSLRHPLRTLLTILGVALAITAFGVVRTMVDAFYAQAEAAAADRLIVRNSVSLVFPLPLAYKEKIARVPGVKGVAAAFWFGGIYIDERNFFAQFAYELEEFFAMAPEFVLQEDQRKQLLAERNACAVGVKLAERFGWELGDNIRLTGSIFPGDWDLVVRAIYTGGTPTTDETQMWLHWDYIEQRMIQEMPGRAGQVGWYTVHVEDPSQIADIISTIDGEFENSTAETLTETEEAFFMSFAEMSGSIITGISLASILIVGVVLLVMVNTMAMTARERTREYGVLKTLGFRGGRLMGLIWGESMTIATIGGLLGVGIMIGLIHAIGQVPAIRIWFPVIVITPMTYGMSAAIALAVALAASLFPIRRAVGVATVDQLRHLD